MTELVVADRAAHWHRLKALVLDSVSSRSRAGFTTSGWTSLSRGSPSSRAPPVLRRRPSPPGAWRSKPADLALSLLMYGSRQSASWRSKGGGQRAAGPGAGVGDREDQGRPVARRARWKLAVAPPSPDAAQHPGRPHEERTARPGHVRHPARLRFTLVGIGGSDNETRPDAR